MPMEARLLLGCLGFSWNSTMLSSPSTAIMPKREASSQGTSSTEMVQAAPAALWASSILS